MQDISIEVSIQQLLGIVVTLEKYDYNKKGNDFYVNMGSKASTEIPAMVCKLREMIELNRLINIANSGDIGMWNTTKVVIGGVTACTLLSLLTWISTQTCIPEKSVGEKIKEGFAKSGYVPTGRKPNKEKHDKIRQLNELGVCKDEICRIVGCGIATVYRVLNINI